MQIITTQEWGAAPPKRGFPLTTPSYIIIHHMMTPNSPRDISKGTREGAITLAQRCQGWHMEGNHWSDTGQNFTVTTGGFILEGRQGTLSALQQGKSIQSAHAGQDAANQSPGIECEGTYSNNVMPKKQWEALVWLCSYICIQTGLTPRMVRGHRDFSPTECPGDWLYSQLPRLKQEVAALLVGGQ